MVMIIALVAPAPGMRHTHGSYVCLSDVHDVVDGSVGSGLFPCSGGVSAARVQLPLL